MVHACVYPQNTTQKVAVYWFCLFNLYPIVPTMASKKVAVNLGIIFTLQHCNVSSLCTCMWLMHGLWLTNNDRQYSHMVNKGKEKDKWDERTGCYSQLWYACASSGINCRISYSPRWTNSDPWDKGTLETIKGQNRRNHGNPISKLFWSTIWKGANNSFKTCVTKHMHIWII